MSNTISTTAGADLMAAEPICKEMVTQGAKVPSSGKWATDLSGRMLWKERAE